MFYYLSLGIIFSLSFAICWSDIRHKLIKNNIILLGFTLGLLLFLIFYFLGVNFDYILKVFVNTLFSFLVSFAIWKVGYWPAGDSKYFTLIAFLLPLHYYRGTYLEYFPSFLLLINIFSLFLLFIFIKSLFIFIKKTVIFFVKNNNNEKLDKINYFKIDIFKKIKNTKYLLNLFFGLILSLIFYYVLTIFYFKNDPHFNNFFIFLVFFAAVRALLNFYTNLQKKYINIDQLKPRFNLDSEVLLILKKDKVLMEKIGTFHPDGLEENQVIILKDYFVINNYKDVVIYNTIPFSLWIIAGVIFTIIYNRPVISIIQNSIF